MQVTSLRKDEQVEYESVYDLANKERERKQARKQASKQEKKPPIRKRAKHVIDISLKRICNEVAITGINRS